MTNLLLALKQFAASGQCGSFNGVVDTSCLAKPNTNNSISTALNVAFGVAAAIALLMIVIGGFRYVTARGDPSSTAQARNTVIYSLIGLVVTMAAYSIVVFVVRNVG